MMPARPRALVLLAAAAVLAGCVGGPEEAGGDDRLNPTDEVRIDVQAPDGQALRVPVNVTDSTGSVAAVLTLTDSRPSAFNQSTGGEREIVVALRILGPEGEVLHGNEVRIPPNDGAEAEIETDLTALDGFWDDYPETTLPILLEIEPRGAPVDVDGFFRAYG